METETDTNTPNSSHIEAEQRWANAGENLAVLNFSEKVWCLSISEGLRLKLTQWRSIIIRDPASLMFGLLRADHRGEGAPSPRVRSGAATCVKCVVCLGAIMDSPCRAMSCRP